MENPRLLREEDEIGGLLRDCEGDEKETATLELGLTLPYQFKEQLVRSRGDQQHVSKEGSETLDWLFFMPGEGEPGLLVVTKVEPWRSDVQGKVKRLRSADHICKPLLQKRWTKPLQEELLGVFVFQYFTTSSHFQNFPNLFQPYPRVHDRHHRRTKFRSRSSRAEYQLLPQHYPTTTAVTFAIITIAILEDEGFWRRG
ncbi:hypothetical protein E3N88_21668 [Mikania micrantha]|uniref:Uncharacterized protein n=1 Tax=Mikania micrantha TaxID=192012 RepID=A0A5N6N9S5_9ASTR|nr:hypothetical protein E3N88_21668 [Mikania micrantha]